MKPLVLRACDGFGQKRGVVAHVQRKIQPLLPSLSLPLSPLEGMPVRPWGHGAGRVLRT